MNAYHPYQSVNYVTCRDGFCLYDLVSYNHKHNEENGQGNLDGTDSNFSWNCGHEGDCNVPGAVTRLRKQQIKNFACLLLLSNGTPMLSSGDEFLHTRKGNSNPYNQDSESVWLDWNRLKQNADIFRFFKKMIAFQKSHPSIGRSRFWREDICWYGVDGPPDKGADSHAFAYCLHGRSADDDGLYVMINSWWHPLDFVIQDQTAAPWRLVLNTAKDTPDDILDDDCWTR